jgi:hypothetical protein
MKPNSFLQIPLQVSPAQFERLQALQKQFSQACNAISPIAQKNRCWNRVALHHLVYRQMRERFSQLGSQMICNAVYSVCRIYRMVYDSPNSPFALSIRKGGSIPLVKFLESNPVYFDRHTLSIKSGVLSMFTLDGRMHFQINLEQKDVERFEHEKLREITLFFENNQFSLTFTFSSNRDEKIVSLSWPSYILVHEVESDPLQEGEVLSSNPTPFLQASQA